MGDAGVIELAGLALIKTLAAAPWVKKSTIIAW